MGINQSKLEYIGVYVHKMMKGEKYFMCVFESYQYRKKKKTAKTVEVDEGLKRAHQNMFYTSLPFSGYDVISTTVKNLLDCELYFTYLCHPFFFAQLSKLLKAGISHPEKCD